jgi:hypothetical protein
MLGQQALGTQVHETDITVRFSEVLVLEGEHEVNGSIYVEENGTLILRNAKINFTQTKDYQFEIRLVNPRGGRPRLIIENSEITTGGYGLLINLYYNSTATIKGLETSNGVRIHGYGDSIIDISDSVLRGLLVYGHGDSRVNATNTSMLGFYSEGYARLYARECEINNTVHTVIRSANVTIQNLHPGRVKYWNLEENHTISFDPLDWRPTIIIEDSDVQGFGIQFGRKSNVTINNSNFRSITTTSQAQLWIHNSATDFALSTRHDSTVYAEDCRFGSSTAKENSTLYLTNTTFQNHWFRGQSQKTEYWYLTLTTMDPANQTIPGATITVAHPNQTIIATGTSDPAGQVMFTLLGGTTNATGTYPVGAYTVTASHQDHQATTDIEMESNQKLDITIPLPIPEPIWAIALLGAILVKIGKDKRYGSGHR